MKDKLQQIIDIKASDVQGITPIKLSAMILILKKITSMQETAKDILVLIEENEKEN